MSVGVNRSPNLDFTRSRQLQQQAHQWIPGGCHTYAKGDDQYPLLAPGFIARGNGCHVWDVDGNEYIEYGMGNRCVVLGHAFPPVVEAARSAMCQGVNFVRPSPLEVECAGEFLSMIVGAEMVKFAKNGSDATTAAVKLARAHTGRDLVALCKDHPFFSTDDWFIGTTPVDAGIPEETKRLTLTFRYNDLASLQALFDQHPGRIACVMLEPAKNDEPKDGFLQQVQAACRRAGAVLVFDEMITGFRWHNAGAQHVYGVTPDLSCFGKGMANGFSLSALAGRRELMRLGGLDHEKPRVFLLSTTHGAETHALAAGIATMRTFQREPVVETLHRQGDRL
ncbi:MAG: glutamate-1-semialdehyde 2,1-aminomutase, partial [Planctomycetes bacterium]|nr:glutamate-1-semialdehyde 2,1-aminomutase [Planctomycetota bacterium]